MPVRFLQVDFQGRAVGEEIHNLLWYYVPAAVGTALTTVADAFVAVGGQVMARFVAAQCTYYNLENLIFDVFDSNWVRELAAPEVRPVGLAGSVPGSLMGQSPCAIMKFALDYSYGDVAPGHGPVKRSYLAFGPLVENAVNNDHAINTSGWGTATVSDLRDTLQQDLVMGALGYTGVAIRCGSTKLLGGGGEDPFHRRSWARIAGCLVRFHSSDRSSRTPR